MSGRANLILLLPICFCHDLESPTQNAPKRSSLKLKTEALFYQQSEKGKTKEVIARQAVISVVGWGPGALHVKAGGILHPCSKESFGTVEKREIFPWL